MVLPRRLGGRVRRRQPFYERPRRSPKTAGGVRVYISFNRPHYMRKYSVALISCLLLIASLGCARDSSLSSDLLHSPLLQSVVELQEARDAPPLVRLLKHRDPAVRARAAFALGSVQDPGAAAELTAMLGDEVATVRADAAFALGQLSRFSRAVESALLEALSSEQDPDAQQSLIYALGKTGSETASEVLTNMDPGGPTGPDGALALSRLLARGEAAPAALEGLLRRLVNTDPAVRENAAWGIANAFIPGSWRAQRERVFSALDGYDRTDEAAANLLRALGTLSDPEARRRIIDWLGASPDWRIRATAAESLGGAETSAERGALVRALDDTSTHVRMAAASALLVTSLATADLDRIAAWVEEHPEDRYTPAALMAVLAAGGRSRTVLDWIRGLSTDDVTRWRRAIEAAALLPDGDAVAVLAEASRSPSLALSGEAIRALAITWVQGARTSSELVPIFYEAFARALRARDPVTEPLLRQVLRDSIFVALGSDSVLSALRPTADTEPTPFPPLDWGFLAELGAHPRLVLETERGVVVVDLFTEEAPLTVLTLARLAGDGRMDGVPFHRVLPNFMVQGGDVERGDGLGDPGFRIPSELTHLRYVRGTLGMARTDKDTENSQFFITHSMQPHLDGGYTAFGHVVEGLDVVDAIMEGDRVVRARIEATAATKP